MKDPNEFRSYSTDRLEEARKWRQLAEAAFQRARFCEDAGREAADLVRIREEFLPDKRAELTKIDERLKQRTGRLTPLDLSFVLDPMVEDLKTWFNTHTNYSGPGPTCPPEMVYAEGTPWPR